MSGGCVIERCSRPVPGGQPMCGWHDSQTPAPHRARLTTAWRNKHRATWGLGLFRDAPASTRQAAAHAFAGAAAEVRKWWAGGTAQ